MQDFFIALAHLDPLAIIRTGGYLGVAALIFAESGLFFGFFLPGDSLLFTAGLLAASNFFQFGPLVTIVALAAILGDSVGYWFGFKVGTAIFKREDSRFFKQEYLHRTQHFYEKYGGRAVVLARFVPIVRTFAPILAGVSTMTYRVFLAYNVLGGLLWSAGMIAIGFFLGSIIPNSERYILPLSLVIILISFLPIMVNVVRHKRAV